LSVLTLALFVMCGASSENKQADTGIGDSGGIEWAGYESGLKKSAENGKYIMAYFWRDG